MEITREQVLRRLPSFRGVLDVSVMEQDTPDIIAAIMETYECDKHAYDRIADLFDAESGEEIAENCFNFLKRNTRYVAEDEDLQTVRSPAAVVQTGLTSGIDCKNLALFCAGVLGALNRQGAGIDWCFRFAAYSNHGLPNRYLKHVFIVLYPGSKSGEIWCDPVLSSFNSREKVPCYYKDAKPMLGRLSGVTSRRTWRTMGQDSTDGTDGTGYDASYSDTGYTDTGAYDSSGGSNLPFTITPIDPTTTAPADTSGSGTSDGSSGMPFDLSQSRSVTQGYASAGADLTPTGNFDPTTATDEINAYDPTGAIQSTNTANWLDSFMKSVLGGGSSSGGGGGGGVSTGGGGQQKQQAQAPMYMPAATPAPTTTGKSSNTIIIVAVVAVLGLGIYLINKK